MAAPALSALPYQSQLAETERWAPQKLREHQFLQLEILAKHAERTVPFYKARFPQGDKGRSTAFERWWRSLPLLTRREVQAAGTSLHSAELPEGHGPVISNTTSGSIGMPVTVLGTTLDARFFKALELRILLWHGFDFSSSFAAIRKLKAGVALSPEGVTFDRWGDTATFPFSTGPSFALNINSSIDEQIDWLTRRRPEYLTVNPTTLAFLIDAMQKRAIGALPIKKILTTAETMRDELRKACNDAWGASIVDIYSAQEVGQIAVQCPSYQHYHVQSEHVLVEILGDDGQECGPGEIGRVVVTPLHNFAMPLLRYEIGDHAEVGEPCPCGRGLPVLRRILGRTRNMLISPTGDKFWPFFGTTRFRKLAPVVQYQFVQTEPDLIEARFVVERPLVGGEEEALRQNIQATVRFPCRVAFKFVSEIPRGESGKYEDFISEVAVRENRDLSP